MMNELKYVYEVYQERSFSKAAKKLYITQPALSAMVKKAEMEIGQPIFDRSTIPLTLTDAGRYYIASAKKILFIQKNMTSYFQDLQHLQTGHLNCTPIVGQYDILKNDWGVFYAKRDLEKAL